MKKLTLILLVLLSLAGCKNEPIFNRTTLFRSGNYNSRNYRIPAIITAKDGTLVTLTDKRKNNDRDLPQDIDVVCRYSEDLGKTWSEPVTVAEGTGLRHGFGDAALALTNDENGLIGVFVGGTGFWQSKPDNTIKTYKIMSYDGGRTWTEPEDITHFIYGSECQDSVRSRWRGSFCASGNGLLTSTGRIMFVAAVHENAEWVATNYVVYSDDNGATWNVSDRASVGGDEAKVVELKNGDILMSMRHKGNRWYNISHDGGVTWNDTVSEWADLVGPACNGDIIPYYIDGKRDTGDGRRVLLHSLPASDKRENVAVYVSEDEGKTWSHKKIVVPYFSAYSSLCVLPDNTIGLYVEECMYEDEGYEMVFYRFDYEWIME